MRALPLFVAASLAFACQGSAGTSGPDPRVAELEKRVAHLEQQNQILEEVARKVDLMVAAIDDDAEVAAELERIAERAAEPGGPIADDELAERLARIADRLDALERKVQSGGRGTGYRRPPSRPRPPRPDPNATYAVPIAGAPYEGPRYAKVTLVKAFEFACPFCERVRPTLEQLRKDYGNDLKIVYKHLIVHPGTATVPAHAACAAHQQGKFVEMKNEIWEHGYKAGRNLTEANMETLAKKIGLAMPRFKADMNSAACKRRVSQDQAEMAKLGARGTPAFFINGRFLSGARPIDQFKAIIDDELAKANQRLKSGTRLRDYYQKWVISKGQTSM